MQHRILEKDFMAARPGDVIMVRNPEGLPKAMWEVVEDICQTCDDPGDECACKGCPGFGSDGCQYCTCDDEDREPVNSWGPVIWDDWDEPGNRFALCIRHALKTGYLH